MSSSIFHDSYGYGSTGYGSTGTGSTGTGTGYGTGSTPTDVMIGF